LPPTLAVAKTVLTIKSNSSKWVSELGRSFAWQKGYAAFSVSASNVAAVERYIRNQEQHHRKVTYENEFIGFLRKHRVPFDPKFVFA